MKNESKPESIPGFEMCYFHNLVKFTVTQFFFGVKSLFLEWWLNDVNINQNDDYKRDIPQNLALISTLCSL